MSDGKRDLSTQGFDFWDRQLRALGERDPMEVLDRTPDRIDALLVAWDGDAFLRRPDPATWSPVEIVGHLLDIEWVFGFRCRTIAFDEEPSFPGIDQERWVERQRWRDADPGELARRFRAAREVNLTFWTALGAEELERTGLHEGAGRLLSLGQMRRILAGHDLVHLDQIEERLEAG